jgi:hypothetical protein
MLLVSHFSQCLRTRPANTPGIADIPSSMTYVSGWLLLFRMRGVHCLRCRRRVFSVCLTLCSLAFKWSLEHANANIMTVKFRPKFLESRRVGLEYFLKSVFHSKPSDYHASRGPISHICVAVSF